jgi:hypothetical protein
VGEFGYCEETAESQPSDCLETDCLETDCLETDCLGGFPAYWKDDQRRIARRYFYINSLA